MTATTTPFDSGALSGAADGEPLLKIRDLVKEFPIRAGVFQRQVGAVQAVSGINLDLYQHETLGIVGESGCGKSTLGRSLLRLVEPTSGTVTFGTEEVTTASKGRMRELRRDLQMVFQDPYASLNPRLPIRDIIGEPMVIHGVPKTDARERVERVALQRMVSLRQVGCERLDDLGHAGVRGVDQYGGAGGVPVGGTRSLRH